MTAREISISSEVEGETTPPSPDHLALAPAPAPVLPLVMHLDDFDAGGGRVEQNSKHPWSQISITTNTVGVEPVATYITVY